MLSEVFAIFYPYHVPQGGGVTPIGAVSRATTGVKTFDRLKMALTA